MMNAMACSMLLKQIKYITITKYKIAKAIVISGNQELLILMKYSGFNCDHFAKFIAKSQTTFLQTN